MNERIRELRKKLGMNQKEFGKKIDVSQNIVSTMEQSGGTVTDRNFNAICKTFNVNPDWLRNGEGEMFREHQPKEALIQSVVGEFELNDTETALLRSFLELPAEHRTGVIAWAKKFFNTMSEQLGAQALPVEEEAPARKPDDELSREEMHTMLDAELDAKEAARKRGTSTSSASTGTSGTSKKFRSSLE